MTAREFVTSLQAVQYQLLVEYLEKKREKKSINTKSMIGINIPDPRSVSRGQSGPVIHERVDNSAGTFDVCPFL